ncbi:MAG TPA: flagellar biosynthetic protein FliO [Kofleriaceae bacterium]|jgi:hypothetical protein
MRNFILLLVALAPAIARADAFELVDHGDSVEVIAHDTHASRTGILPVRSRLEVPIAPRAIAKTLEADRTVKLVEIDGGRLSVKTGFEHDDVVQLARYAQAIQVGADLHIIVPRKVPVAGAAPTLPEPAIPTAAAPIVAPAPVVAPTPAPVAAPAPIAPAPAPMEPSPNSPGAIAQSLVANAHAAPPVATAPLAAPAPVVAPTPTPVVPKAQLAPEDGAGNKLPVYGGLGLVALLAGAYLLRKKRGNSLAATSIDVIAQRSLGGKARIVWLAAGPRELLVTVTPQHVRLVGQWKKGDAPAALPFAQTHGVAQASGLIAAANHAAANHAAVKAPEHPSSPAIAGLLRLRDRATEAPEINDDVATGDADADALWAREILRATGGRR